MRPVVSFLALLGLMVTAVPASADLAPPRRPENNNRTAEIAIEVDPEVDQATLYIPVRNLFAPPGRGGFGGQPDGAAPPDEPKPDQASAQPSSHLLIAGVALALSLTLTGFWIVRRQGRVSGRGLGIFLVMGLTLGAGAWVWGNVPPPPDLDEPEEPVPAPESSALYSGKVQIRFTNDGDAIRLVLDKVSLEALKTSVNGD